MERTSGRTQGLKKAVAVLALMAAMASTGCGQNALLNPTSDQISASGDSNQAKSVTSDSGGQGLNPAGGQGLNP
jgi:hypothetical protein